MRGGTSPPPPTGKKRGTRKGKEPNTKFGLKRGGYLATDLFAEGDGPKGEKKKAQRGNESVRRGLWPKAREGEPGYSPHQSGVGGGDLVRERKREKGGVFGIKGKGSRAA